jgi:hypothetical protein
MKKRNRIGSVNESSLHETLKNLYAAGGHATESNLDGYVVDIAAEGLVIEIQTGGFSSVRDKIASLLPNHRIKLVYPVAVEKTIVVVDPETKETVYRRKSPKKGELIDIAGEILYIPRLVLHPNFSLEVLLTKEEEVRTADGKGSWRRRGMSIADRKLIEIIGRVEFKQVADYLRLLPDGLPESFTNRFAAGIMSRPVEKIGRLTYSLRRLGLLEVTGREGNANVFRVAVPRPSPRSLSKRRPPGRSDTGGCGNTPERVKKNGRLRS